VNEEEKRERELISERNFVDNEETVED